jgi:hypothetical protein
MKSSLTVPQLLIFLLVNHHIRQRRKKNLSIYVSKPSHPTGKFLTVAHVLVIVGGTQFLVPQPNLITGLLRVMSETDLISEHHNVIAT